MDKNCSRESSLLDDTPIPCRKRVDGSYALLKDRMGKRSLMRFALLIALILGSIMIVSSIIGFFQQNPQATSFALAGSGLISLTAGAKALQGSKGF